MSLAEIPIDAGMPYGLLGYWQRLTLAWRFTVAAALSILCVLVLGGWASRTLEAGSIDAPGVAESAGHFLSPYLQEPAFSWLVVALLAAAMVLALFSIVADGSRTIERQRSALTRHISELSNLLQQNKALHDRVKRGARQVVEDQENFLRQIGSELHDGPAQLIGLALLRLDPLHATGSDGKMVHDALDDALDEIRNISAGLLLPEARGQNLEEALRHTIGGHERRTRTTVSFLAGKWRSEPPQHVNQCLCRVVQEGLSNAFRHAEGRGQCVVVRSDDKSIIVEIHDEGPGFMAGRVAADHRHMGLLGLRGRVESIGGTLAVYCLPNRGTRLIASLPMREEEQ